MESRKFKKTNLPPKLKKEKLLEINYLEIAKKAVRKLRERIKRYGAS